MVTLNTPEIRERLRELAKVSGTLTPDAVVADARDEASPLHRCFEWDDAKAAHEARIERARVIIHTVHVEYTVEERTIKTVEWVRNPDLDNEDQGYVPMAHVQSDRETARKVLGNELSRVESAIARARNVAAAIGLQRDFERALAVLLKPREVKASGRRKAA